MGRRPTKHSNLPRHMRARIRGDRTYYYYDTGKKPRHEIPLGADYALAVRKWAELELDLPVPAVVTFRYIAEVWQRECIREKAPKTQREYLAQLKTLYGFFDKPPAPLAKIEPLHIKKYLRWRKASPIAATREKALFSAIWNWARGEGYTDKANPCAGIKGAQSKRTIYVYDDAYLAVWNAADLPTRDVMDLIYLSGQRPGDCLRMQESDIREDAIEVTQAKTGHKVRVNIVGELAVLIGRIQARKKANKVRSLALLCDESGQRLTYFALRKRFDKAREIAGISFQLRDLRAKAVTDKTESKGVRAAQIQAGHKSVTTTEIYVRSRRGQKADPTR